MGLKDALEKALPTLRVAAPVIAAAIGGPIPAAAKVAIDVLGAALGSQAGSDEATATLIADKIQSATPQDLLALRQAEQTVIVRLEELGLDRERLVLENANQVNQTMQVEANAVHWPTYSWRPAIGFAVAANVVLTSLIVGMAYGGVILGGRDPSYLEHVPGMIGSMAILIGPVAPILGIASWFRGKMQADPNIQTDNRG